MHGPETLALAGDDPFVIRGEDAFAVDKNEGIVDPEASASLQKATHLSCS